MLPKMVYGSAVGHEVIAEDTQPRTYTVREVGLAKRVMCTTNSERTAVAIANGLAHWVRIAHRLESVAAVVRERHPPHVAAVAVFLRPAIFVV